ncbi:unnamed protein product [Urochloa decumbens]|uniref:Myb-like domain-containing protein n=1 Tax=Urochloa decumbens TaxID=240449 RepID=A0ABC9H6F8_9POAL
MGRRSKREVAPRPPPPPPAASAATVPGCFGATSSASVQAAPGAMALPPEIQPAWWNGPMPQANPFNPGFPDCGMDFRPPGGFVNLLQTGQQPFVPPHVSLPPPWPPTAPATDSGTQHGKSRSKAKSFINIDDGDEVRTTKRLTWSPDEDLRLVSAWLYHSNDPINGNGKKNDSYWGDVVELYNITTPTIRKEIEPKWHAVLEEIEISKKRGLDDGGNSVMQEDIGEKERPMGRNEAKKQRYGKGKGKAKDDDDDNLHEEMKKYMDIQTAASKRHEEFLETQKHISDAKVEAARLRREAVLTDSYQKLLSMDTSEMTDEMKAEHVIGLKMLRDKLLGNII